MSGSAPSRRARDRTARSLVRDLVIAHPTNRQRMPQNLSMGSRPLRHASLRRPGLLAACLLVALLSGCGAQGKYRDAVHDAVPRGWKPAAPCDGSSGTVEPADYRCTYLLHANVAPLATQLVHALEAHGFSVQCGYRGLPVVVGTRSAVSLRAEFYSWEAVHGGTQPNHIPRGVTFID